MLGRIGWLTHTTATRCSGRRICLNIHPKLSHPFLTYTKYSYRKNMMQIKDGKISHVRGSLITPDSTVAQIPNYVAINPRHPSINQLHADLALDRFNAIDENKLGPDVNELSLSATYETPTRLRVRIADKAGKRWVVPPNVVILNHSENGNTPLDPSQATYDFRIIHEPFSFRVARKEHGAAAIFDTAGQDFIFKDQYIEISTRLPQDTNIYGLGEVNSSFRRQTTGDGSITTLWSRDAPLPKNENIYGCQPFYIELRPDGLAHGVLLLNSNGMDIQLQPDRLTYRVIGGILDFYFFLGPSPADVVAQYVDFIGRPAMPPLWALGKHQCRWGYNTVGALEKLVEGYQNDKIPLDGLWIDIDYMDMFKVFTLDSVNYPLESFQTFIDHLHKANKHLVTILDPGIKVEQGFSAYETLLSSSAFVSLPSGAPYVGVVWPGKCIFPDWFNPAAHKWWAGLVREWVKKTRVEGLWVDMNELAAFSDGDVSEIEEDVIVGMIPSMEFFDDSSDGEMESRNEEEMDKEDAESRNVEIAFLRKDGEEESEGLKKFETKHPGFTEEDGKVMSVSENKILDEHEIPQPPFSITNPPYRINNGGKHLPLEFHTSPPDALHLGGIVEYDVHNLYGHMECQATRKTLIEISPEKKPFILTRSTFIGTGRYAAHWLGDNWSTFESMASSIPGMLNFQLFGIPLVGADIGGFIKACTEELLIRWTQLGAFYPFMRNHNGLPWPSQEPYVYSGSREAAKKWLGIRYSLLPTWYTLFWRASEGGPGRGSNPTVVRPLWFEFPTDKETYPIDRQFLLGSSLLISPVLEHGATSVHAYLPTSVTWFDFFTGDRAIEGWQNLPAQLSNMPVHIRGGAIIPLYTHPGLSTTETKVSSNLRLLIALDEDGKAEGEVYQDDDTPLPAKNSFFAQFKVENGVLSITNVKSIGPSQPNFILDEVTIYGIDSKDKKRGVLNISNLNEIIREEWSYRL